MKSTMSKYVHQSTTTTSPPINDNDSIIPPNHRSPHLHQHFQYNNYTTTGNPPQVVLSHPPSRRSSISSAVQQQLVNKSDELLLTEQVGQKLSPRSDRVGLVREHEGRDVVERNANWEQGNGVQLEMVPLCQCTVKDHHATVQRPKYHQHQHHIHNFPSQQQHQHSHPHHHAPSHHGHQHFTPTKYNSVQNIALVNHQPFCASLSKLDGQWSSSTLMNSPVNSNNHQYSLERRISKKLALKKQHSYTCESHQQQQLTQQQRIMARVERDLRMQQAQHLTRSPPPPLPPEILSGNLLTSDGGFVTQKSDSADVADSEQQQVLKSPYSGSVGSAGRDSVIDRGQQGAGDDYGFSKRMQGQQDQSVLGQGQVRSGGGDQQGRGSKRNSLRSNGGSGGKRRPDGDGMAAITPLQDNNTDLIFELPDQMNESDITLTVDGATTIVDCEHIIYGPGFTCMHFIPIKSIEILNVTNCDRFREAAIISNVTVTPAHTITGPETGKDSDGSRVQTVSISFTNDVTLDENSVLSISDMIPNRNLVPNFDTPAKKWVRNKVYIDRYNLCDILNNYLTTALFGKNNNNNRRKLSNTHSHGVDEDTDINNIESNNLRTRMLEINQKALRLCPIVAGRYVLPKFKWIGPSVSVPAIFLGYQKYVLEVLNPSIEEKIYKIDSILMCKVVTVFLHPKKNYN